MTSRYKNKQGEEVSLAEWCMLTEDEAYWRVSSHHTKGYRVSTVWLGGIDFGHGNKLMPFETLVFDPKGLELSYRDRYATEEDALDGHQKAVEWLYRYLEDKETKDA